MSSGNSPLVLIHGFTGQAEVWSGIQSIFSEFLACHAIELPGHGVYTDLNDAAAFTFSGASTRIIHEFTERGLQRVNLWGYSLGGRMAMHVALSNPECIDFLILESSSPGLADPAERQARVQSDEELAQRIESEGVESFVDYWINQPLFASQKLLPPAKQELGRRLRLQGTATGYAAALRAFSVGRQEPLHNRLRELTMPVLVIAGELDQKYRELGAYMADSIPNAQFRIISGAGHAPHWERPAETASAVAEFIQTVSRS